MPFFSKVFRSRDSSVSSRPRATASLNDARTVLPSKPAEDAWIRKEISAEEVQELLHACTQEMKARALNMPFLLLPFRPVSDPSAAKYFIRNFFLSAYHKSDQYRGQGLFNELRLVEPVVLGSILKWCWSRLKGGVVTWDTYELFKVGEKESNMAKHAFDTFIPLSVESEARRGIVFDFFDLLAAISANGKANGLGGRKLSRLAGWWAFEFSDVGKGFDGGYRSWENAADATCHLYFAYLRSLSSDPSGGVSGISKLPRSLEALLSQTEYPPEPAYLLQTTAPKVVMMVNAVSPTPFALLRRAKHFEYRDDDRVLQQFSDYDDPVQALTPECRRVLEAISSTNRNVIHLPTSQVAPASNSDNSWSRFEDIGFSSLLDDSASNGDANNSRFSQHNGPEGLRTSAASPARDLGRPTTPSWADFLSEGFTDGSAHNQPQPLLLPPNQILPPISPSRIHSSQSHVRNGLREDTLEPGELASINKFEMDETFWWVWMTSLAAEEPPTRKAVFGRCALIETDIQGGRWLVIEEQVKGASPAPEEGAYVAEKKGRFTLTRGRTRRRSTGKKVPDRRTATTLNNAPSKTSILPAQQAKVQAAAAALIQEQKDREASKLNARRSRTEPDVASKTTSVMTLQPVIMKEAAPAMKWASKFDKEAIRAKYLGDSSFGKGQSHEDLHSGVSDPTINAPPAAEVSATTPPKAELSERELPVLPVAEPIPEPAIADMTIPYYPPETTAPKAEPVTSTVEREITPSPIPVQEVSPEPEHAPMNIIADEPTHGIEKTLDTRNIQEPVISKPMAQDTSMRTNRAPTIEAAVKAWESKAQSSNTTPEKVIPAEKPKKAPSRGFKKLFSRNKTDKPMVTTMPYLAPGQSTIVNRQTQAIRPSPPSELDSPFVNPKVDTRQVESDFGVMDGGEPGPVVANNVEESYSSAHVNRAIQQPSSSAMASDNLPSAPRTPSAVSSMESDFHPQRNGLLYDYNGDDHLNGTSLDAQDESVPKTIPSYSNSVDLGNGGPRETYGTDRTYDLADDETSEVDHPYVSSNPSANGQVVDRWAQIRKNAAERRASEEQSQLSGRPSQSGRTVGTERSDEGETSGEETIESRVARIKARVAELTGNLESSRADDSAGAAGPEPAYSRM